MFIRELLDTTINMIYQLYYMLFNQYHISCFEAIFSYIEKCDIMLGRKKSSYKVMYIRLIQLL